MKRLHILAIGLLIAFAVSLQAVQSVINVGSSANDGTGDTLRSAMQKVNSNFTELYGTIFNFNGNQFGSTTSTNIFIKSGAPLTNSVFYGSTSGSWTVGSTGTLTADTARTVTTTSGSLTLSSGSSHVVLSPSSSVGVGTTGPDAKLDVLSTSGSQYRATYTDGSVYSDWGTLSTGATLWTNSLGHRMTSTTVNDTSILARQVQGGLAFDGVTTTAKDIHTIADIATSDVTLSATFLCPTVAANSGILLLSSSATTYSTARSLFLYLSSDGKLYIELRGVTGADSKYGSIASFITNYGGKIVNVTCVRSTSGITMTVYVNGVATTLSEASAGTDPTWAGTILSTYGIVGFGSSTYLFPSTIFSATLFNRALSASEVVTLANQGVAESDKWGSLTAAYTSDFSATASPNPQNNWTALAGTVTGDIDGIGSPSTDDTLRYWADGTSANHGPRITTVNLTANKRYKVAWSYFIPSGNTTLKRVAIYGQSGATFSGSVVQTVTGTWTDVVSEGYLASTQGISFLGLTSASSGVWVGANSVTDDLLYIKNVVITPIGSILDADLSAGVGYQVPDRSSNKYHGVVSATGTAWTLPNRRGQIRYTTTGATTGAFQLLSSTAIPSNAQIQSIVAWSAGTPLIYVGNATGTSNIVGHTTLAASTYTKLTQALDFSTTGNLWLNKSATNEVNLTVNYMINDP
jgi:hypothetical protein